jgi:hypothetical protein
VTIAVTPDVTSTIVISGFEPDEVVAPGPLHLSPGHYSIQVTAHDYVKQSREIDVTTSPQQVSFALLPLTMPNPQRATKLPYYVMDAGGVLLLAGLAIDVFKVRPLRDQLAKSQFEYRANEGAFSTWRNTTIGCYGLGAIVVGIGVWLEVRRRELPFTVNASVGHDGTSVEVTWLR